MFVPTSHCPVCGYEFKGGENDDAPRPGNLAICCECAVVLAFDDNLAVRIISFSEAIGIALDADLAHTIYEAQEVIRKAHKIRSKALMN